jgi:hypothetical protein
VRGDITRLEKEAIAGAAAGNNIWVAKWGKVV